ncbi:MAG: hypothetical protein JOZ77_08360 [Candidatus Eremiobacteraeota bacterium]|nr:hypothetical protein [Candidatus Eremiobacteraeota bacterium]
MKTYSARIGESYCVADGVSYEMLVRRIMEFTIRAALARSIDESEWEQEELRRQGLRAIQIFEGNKAIWAESAPFREQLLEAQRENITSRFERTNRADPELFQRLDRDLIERWRRAGYQTSSLANDMKGIFLELGRDAEARAEGAKEELVDEILREVSR